MKQIDRFNKWKQLPFQKDQPIDQLVEQLNQTKQLPIFLRKIDAGGVVWAIPYLTNHVESACLERQLNDAGIDTTRGFSQFIKIEDLETFRGQYEEEDYLIFAEYSHASEEHNCILYDKNTLPDYPAVWGQSEAFYVSVYPIYDIIETLQPKIEILDNGDTTDIEEVLLNHQPLTFIKDKSNEL